MDHIVLTLIEQLEQGYITCEEAHLKYKEATLYGDDFPCPETIIAFEKAILEARKWE